MATARYLQIVHTWMFGDMPMPKIAEHLCFAGADGVDLSIATDGPSSPESLMQPRHKRTLEQAGLPVLCTTPLHFSPRTDLSSADPALRKQAVDFAKRAVDATAYFGCDKMLVSPSWVSVLQKLEQPHETHWRHAVEAVREIAPHAARRGVTLLVEPINRYRVSLVHTVREGLRFIGDVEEDNVALVADIFHMNIEESRGVVNALHEAAPKLQCVHIGENTRQCPGYGAADWGQIMSALRQTGYAGPLSYEPAELYFDAGQVARDETCARAFATRLKHGIAYLNALMDGLPVPD